MKYSIELADAQANQLISGMFAVSTRRDIARQVRAQRPPMVGDKVQLKSGYSPLPDLTILEAVHGEYAWVARPGRQPYTLMLANLERVDS